MEELKTPAITPSTICAILAGTPERLARRLKLEPDKTSEFDIYFYDVGYHSFEDSGSFQLISKQRYTDEQFADLINEVAAEVVKYRLEAETQKVRENYEQDIRWIEQRVKSDDPGYPDYRERQTKRAEEELEIGWNPNFSDIYADVISVLCGTHGFQRIAFAASFSVDGWAKLRETNAAFLAKGDDTFAKLSQAVKDVLGEIKEKETEDA